MRRRSRCASRRGTHRGARRARLGACADALRREILTLGYVVEDRPDGYRLKPNG